MSYPYSNIDCGSACLGAGIDGLVGFDRRNQYCFCRYDDGIVDTANLPPGLTSSFDRETGSGEISSIEEAYNTYCYKIPVSSFLNNMDLEEFSSLVKLYNK